MGKICPCRSHQKNTIWIRRRKRKTRRKQDLTKEDPTDPDFQGSASESLHKRTQNELNNDLELPKIKSELLASRMKQRKYLDDCLKITLYLYRQKNLEEFFTMEGTLGACKGVDGLFKALNMSHCSDEWRFFIDSSKVSLKAVLLHNGNVLLSIPVARAFGIKEIDDSMKHNSEINPTRCNNCVYSSQWLYSTRFGWQFHPSSGVQCSIWPQVGRYTYVVILSVLW